MAGLHATSVISLFLLIAVASHAASSPQEEYWHRVLPNTPIPNAIREILNIGDPKKAIQGMGENFLAGPTFNNYVGGIGSQRASCFVVYIVGRLNADSTH